MERNMAGRRIWELDFLRGMALVFMIYFHIVFDMKEIFGYNVIYGSGVNYYIGKVSAILFMLVSGVSCSLSRSNVKRGLKVLAAALVISLGTWLYNPQFVIVFGILHFFGVSMLLYPLVSRLNKYIILALGTLLIVLGSYFSKISPAHNYFFMFGIINNSFVSSDYYPLVPWFGVFLYGVSAGRILYPKKQSLLPFKLKENFISNAGRRTLIVYLVHQPAIMLTLTLVQMFKRA